MDDPWTDNHHGFLRDERVSQCGVFPSDTGEIQYRRIKTQNLFEHIACETKTWQMLVGDATTSGYQLNFGSDALHNLRTLRKNID